MAHWPKHCKRLPCLMCQQGSSRLWSKVIQALPCMPLLHTQIPHSLLRGQCDHQPNRTRCDDAHPGEGEFVSRGAPTVRSRGGSGLLPRSPLSQARVTPHSPPSPMGKDVVPAGGGGGISGRLHVPLSGPSRRARRLLAEPGQIPPPLPFSRENPPTPTGLCNLLPSTSC